MSARRQNLPQRPDYVHSHHAIHTILCTSHRFLKAPNQSVTLSALQIDELGFVNNSAAVDAQLTTTLVRQFTKSRRQYSTSVKKSNPAGSQHLRPICNVLSSPVIDFLVTAQFQTLSGISRPVDVDVCSVLSIPDFIHKLLLCTRQRPRCRSCHQVTRMNIKTVCVQHLLHSVNRTTKN